MKKKSFLRNAILLSLLVGATTVYSPVVMAADDVAASGDSMEFAMEEYVVTASRTQTAKVDTPANVSTIDAAKIESRRYQDVAEALKKEHIDIDKRKIAIQGEVTGEGVYEAVIKVHPSVTSKIKVRIVAE